ncbi:hypothetical protein JCM1841_003211 [Sporobolomyces salmonicolor]
MSLARLLTRLTLQRAPQSIPAALPPLAAPFSSLASTSSAPRPSRQSRLPAFPAIPASTRTYASEVSHPGNLSPNPGSTHKRKRIGRGIGSGRGGTSGRGHKGQGARSGNGKPAAHFAGGQTPLTRAYPKRGSGNPMKQDLVAINLERLQRWIDRGLIDPSQPITMRELCESRCVHGVRDGVKLLGDGAEHFRTPNLHVTVSKASQSAIAAIERLNGTLVARYENRLTLRALVRPESFARKGRPLPGKADPISRRDLLYYSDAKHRGYLALEAAALRADAATDVRGESEAQEVARPEGVEGTEKPSDEVKA